MTDLQNKSESYILQQSYEMGKKLQKTINKDFDFGQIYASINDLLKTLNEVSKDEVQLR